MFNVTKKFHAVGRRNAEHWKLANVAVSSRRAVIATLAKTSVMANVPLHASKNPVRTFSADRGTTERKSMPPVKKCRGCFFKREARPNPRKKP